jgi:hypothetical protein
LLPQDYGGGRRPGTGSLRAVTGTTSWTPLVAACAARILSTSAAPPAWRGDPLRGEAIEVVSRRRRARCLKKSGRSAARRWCGAMACMYGLREARRVVWDRTAFVFFLPSRRARAVLRWRERGGGRAGGVTCGRCSRHMTACDLAETYNTHASPRTMNPARAGCVYPIFDLSRRRGSIEPAGPTTCA